MMMKKMKMWFVNYTDIYLLAQKEVINPKKKVSNQQWRLIKELNMNEKDDFLQELKKKRTLLLSNIKTGQLKLNTLIY